ncbi:2-oxoisovalerate dehydrogenase subunit alpha, mitochondrial-like [Saccoglossus kowalevskii]|uniref:2-oxoisovalerate dehydrogenase subunit alpha n=1 Tax=Saccoglossus kowalevskii TaxID=10224 RepID=A0ABM0LZH9_SACKO|nr:PREDICTED: 2-oxoisovalerate dehydrogenase subunit alpha, mitochondrial-like [Saccoglossus kowalevskii]
MAVRNTFYQFHGFSRKILVSGSNRSRIMSACRYKTTDAQDHKYNPKSLIEGTHSLVDDDKPHFPGSWKSRYVDKLELIKPELHEGIPTYRVLNWDGDIVNPKEELKLGKDLILKMYKSMVKLHSMDDVMFNSQRQGRLSFYMTANGEEAIHIGSAAALDNEDEVYGQYREQGVLMWRGYTLDEFVDLCLGNEYGHGRGRTNPTLYGSKELHYITLSAPLSTEMPQAAGYAYALKRSGSKNCVVCFFGDGAASEGDAHAGFNFASTLEVPVIYICRNNGYAISTHSYEQYHGDGIAARASGYGICAIRVDGNDMLAVYNAIKAARDIALSESRPVIVEAMTYRLGHHSTSDDPTTYRTDEEAAYWGRHHPIDRCRKFITKKGWWSDEEEKTWYKETRQMIINSMDRAEKKLLPNPHEIFTDVYDELPERLKQQSESLQRHLKEYKDEYPDLTKFHME